MTIAVATANSIKVDSTEIAMMSYNERVQCFIGIYNLVKGKGCTTNFNFGTSCALLAYANREMRYRTTGYLLLNGFSDNEHKEDEISNSSYVSSKYANSIQDEIL